MEYRRLLYSVLRTPLHTSLPIVASGFNLLGDHMVPDLWETVRHALRGPWPCGIVF